MIDDAEDGGGGADAERQGGDGDRAEAGALAQHPRRKPQIGAQDVHGETSSRVCGRRMELRGYGSAASVS